MYKVFEEELARGNRWKNKAVQELSWNYERYQNHIKVIENKISLVIHKMENVHSIDFEKPSGSVTFNDRPMIELIEKKSPLEKEKQYYMNLIGWIDGGFRIFWFRGNKRADLDVVYQEKVTELHCRRMQYVQRLFVQGKKPLPVQSPDWSYYDPFGGNTRICTDTCNLKEEYGVSDKKALSERVFLIKKQRKSYDYAHNVHNAHSAHMSDKGWT